MADEVMVLRGGVVDGLMVVARRVADGLVALREE